MSYHKPPDLPWRPIPICEHLRELGADANVANDCVQIAAVIEPDASWIGNVLNDLLPDRAGSFSISIQFFPSRFIRNVEVQRDVKLSGVYRVEIDESLTQQGYLHLTDELEASIARKYSPSWSEIEKLEKEITGHQKRKEQLVDEQDFDAAVDARNMEYDARARLDALVREAAANE